MQIELLVDQINEDRVTLKTSEDQIIYWPSNKLPSNLKEGSMLVFSIDDKNSTPAKNEVAKEILNEILGHQD